MTNSLRSQRLESNQNKTNFGSGITLRSMDRKARKMSIKNARSNKLIARTF